MALRAVQTIWIRHAPRRWLDVGTGSGILAVAAARLGATEVFALDPERASPPQALAMARLNGVESRVTAWRGGLDTVWGPFPAVVANLVADLIGDHSAALADLVEPGGTLFAGGIVDRRWPETSARLEAAGLHSTVVLARGRWRGGLWKRPVDAGF